MGQKMRKKMQVRWALSGLCMLFFFIQSMGAGRFIFTSETAEGKSEHLVIKTNAGVPNPSLPVDQAEAARAAEEIEIEEKECVDDQPVGALREQPAFLLAVTHSGFCVAVNPDDCFTRRMPLYILFHSWKSAIG